MSHSRGSGNWQCVTREGLTSVMSHLIKCIWHYSINNVTEIIQKHLNLKTFTVRFVSLPQKIKHLRQCRGTRLQLVNCMQCWRNASNCLRKLIRVAEDRMWIGKSFHMLGAVTWNYSEAVCFLHLGTMRRSLPWERKDGAMVSSQQ